MTYRRNSGKCFVSLNDFEKNTDFFFRENNLYKRREEGGRIKRENNKRFIEKKVGDGKKGD